MLFWLNEQFLIEFEEHRRYALQNEIRRLTDDVYMSKLQRVKEKLQDPNISSSESKNLNKVMTVYEECIKTLENWKVVE